MTEKQEAVMNGKADCEELERPLYDPELLFKLDWSSVKQMKDGITCKNPGSGFVVRPLCKGDYDKGLLQLLAQLTKVGDVSRSQFEEQFDWMHRCKDHYYVTVVEDLAKGKIVASATLAVELKLIHGCSKRGRLEDVVVSEEYRGKQLGKLIVMTITLLAKEVGCYKIGLDCRDNMRVFYGSLGYIGEIGNDRSMIIRFE